MSSWTEVLLTASALEDIGNSDNPDRYAAVEHINEWLRDSGWWDLFLIRPNDPTKHGPNSCFAGHFKSLDEKRFIAAVQAAPWQWPETVQLFLRGEHDDRFREVTLNLPHSAG